jgi:hypothetical protein
MTTRRERIAAMAPTLKAEPLYTRRQVADLFGVTIVTVGRWHEKGQIPQSAIIRTIGGHYRYRAAYVDGLLGGHQATPRNGAREQHEGEPS